MKFRNTLIALVVAVVTGHSAALSLGESRSIVVLGRSPDLLFNIEPDPGVPVNAACITAEILLGTTPISSSKIQITPAPDRPSAVRLRASVIVNEPILTVYLLAGCSAKIRRTYTFLTDLPDAVAATATPLMVAQPTRPLRPLDSVSSTATPQPQPQPQPLPKPKPLAPSDLPSYKTPTEPVEIVKPQQKAPIAVPLVEKSPDRLLPAAPAIDLPPPTTTSPVVISELAPVPPKAEASEPAKMSTASEPSSFFAVAQPVNINAPVNPLKTEIPVLPVDTAKVQISNEGWFDYLNRIDIWGFSDEVVYGLLALLAAALAGAAWLWHRARAPWHRTKEHSNYFGTHDGTADSVPADELTFGPTPDFEENIELFLAPDISKNTPDALARLQPKPINTPSTSPSASARPMEMPDEPLFETHFQAPVTSVTQVAEVINPEDLFDLQQQADFFASVGEHDQAIDVMKKHIAENEKSSPLAYLDLLRLYHSLSRRDDFNYLRDQFLRYFNAKVPDFVKFHQPGLTLAGYPEALARIEAQWSTPAVLQELEGCLFRHDETTTPPFDLIAYDDLLLLYAIAKTTPPSARGAPPPRIRTTPLIPEQTQEPEPEPIELFVAPKPAKPILSLPDADQNTDFGDGQATSLAFDAMPPTSVLANNSIIPSTIESPKSTLGLLDRGLDLDMGLDIDAAASFSWDTAPPVEKSAPAPAPTLTNNALLDFDDSWLIESESAPLISLSKAQAKPLDLDLTLPSSKSHIDEDKSEAYVPLPSLEAQ